mmetsp:Transcript_14117/g.33529  ORF Transcript_14117/g.33529 Transcript_14117/m.33529 type:complete len:671 (+) Transcript_14117:63-2075(+)
MPLPGVLSNCLDAVSNRLEELSYHCKQLHDLNQSLEVENASMRLKLSASGVQCPPSFPRRDLEASNCAVSTPEVAEAVRLKVVKDVFLEPEPISPSSPTSPTSRNSDLPLPLPGVLPLPELPPAEPVLPHPWLPEGTSDASLRALGVAPSRATSFQTLRDVDEDEIASDDVQYVDAKSMRFDTLVSHRLQLITDTRLADDEIFAKDQWKQAVSICQALEEERQGAKLIELIVNSLIFKTVSTVAIAFNAIYIGVRTDQQIQNSYSRVLGQVPMHMDNTYDYLFLAWFSTEVAMHLIAYGWRFWVGKDWIWNLFDLFLVTNTAMEVIFPDLFVNMSFLRIFRVLRLVRVVRLVRTVRWLRSLRTMLFAMLSSMACLLWAFVMICFIMFVFAIVFGSAAASYFDVLDVSVDENIRNAEEVFLTFGSIYESFVTLFSTIFGGNDWMLYGTVLRSLGSGELYFCLYLFYIGFCLVGLLNVVTGIFVDSAVTTRTEDEVVDSYREDLQRTSDEVKRIFHSADISSNGKLTLEAFSNCLKQNAWVAAYFAGLDIGADDAGTIFTLMDTNNSGDITVEEFVQGTMKLKGHAKSVDIFAIMFDLTRLGLQVQKLCSLVEDQFRDIKRMVDPERQLSKKRLFKPLKQLMSELDVPDAEDDPTRSCRLRVIKRLSQARVA